MSYVLEVGKKSEGLARHFRVTMADGDSRRVDLLCPAVPVAEPPDIPGVTRTRKVFPYDTFGSLWPMKFDFGRKLPIINQAHCSQDEHLSVKRAVEPFQHLPDEGVAQTKALAFYDEIRTFSVGLATVASQVPVLDEQYDVPLDVVDAKDHLLRVALKLYFESASVQRAMSQIVKLKPV